MNILIIHGKNGFVERFKFSWIQIRKVLLNYQNDYVELIVRISTFFAVLLIIFKVPLKY